MQDFVQQITDWQQTHGRHDLPWQNTSDPYRIWLSEIMLQQTQVVTVIAYYQRFLQAFPNLVDLAQASQQEVLALWAGLGYYARARNLHRCAQIIQNDFNGQFPLNVETLIALPGIGQSTAHAIVAFCDQQRKPIMDGNVKRVFTRFFGITGDPNKAATNKVLWTKANEILAQNNSASMISYTQGLMDLGATICKRKNPACGSCPLQANCFAYKNNLQNSLPTPKAKKTIPSKKAYFLIQQFEDQVLVEQRPDSGIWGGLYSLPEYSTKKELQVELQNRGFSLSKAQELKPFKHLFSHYQLTLHPYLIYFTPTSLFEPYPTQHWLKLEQLEQAALPRPIFNLLKQIQKNQFK